MAPQNLRKTVLTNLASNYLVGFIGMALGFLLVPFLIGKLGKEAFGLTVLAESAILFFEILTISVRIALSRHATFSLAQGKEEEFAEYLSTGRVLAFITVGVVAVIAVPIGLNFSRLFQVPAAYVEQSETLFFLVGAAFCMTIPNSVYWSVLYAHQRFDLINLSSSVGLIVRALLLFALFSVLPPAYVSLVTYGLVYLAMTLTQNMMVYFWHKRLMPGLRISASKFRRERVRDILSFSAHTSLSRLSNLLYDNTGNILVNVFWGPAATAVYAVALRIPSILKRLFLDTTWTLAPTFTDLVARGEKRRVENLLFIYAKLVSIVTIPMSLGVIFFARELLLMWVGPGFEEAEVLLVVFTVPLTLLLPLAVGGSLTNAYGKVSVPSKVSFGFAVLNVFLGVLLGRTLGFGPAGIALAASGCTIVFSCVFGPMYVSHISGISLRKYLTAPVFKPLAVSLLVFGLMRLFWQDGLGSPQILSAPALALFACSTAVYAALAWLLLVSAEEKKHLSEMLGPLFNRFGGTK